MNHHRNTTFCDEKGKRARKCKPRTGITQCNNLPSIDPLKFNYFDPLEPKLLGSNLAHMCNNTHKCALEKNLLEEEVNFTIEFS